VTSGHAQMVRFPHEDRNVRCLAETCRALGDGVEHRLDVAGRARDDAQDVARGGLLIERLAQGALQVRIRRPWRAALKSAREGGTALPAELLTCGILVLAPGTLHAAPPSGSEPETVGQVARG
jgi:hypothetical protein